MVKILPPKPRKQITFKCAHCGCRFITDDWSYTKRGHSADCPSCPYKCWTPR